ncbi:S28 family serine protease [Nocardia brevicatena]|uniref:S28 family serine protease n=1 Tax=Nocardia brevicatena TaxID=37327 RepID=UPI00031C74FA|nr:S28 family serine protease [Nocardia brevicatena]
MGRLADVVIPRTVKWHLFTSALLIGLLVHGTVACADTDDIRARIQAIPGLRLVSEESTSSGLFFELVIRQPVDHRHPERGDFEQRLTLLHKSTGHPMVVYTGGYDLNRDRAFRAEPTEIVAGNQIAIEHRYFGASRPTPLDWSHLDIRQAAGDQHRVIEALRMIYQGAWISAGVSKGGMAAVYHRRFYPDDVVGTVAYGAPDNTDDGDSTAYDLFVEQVGTPACRAALATVQRRILLQRNEVADLLSDWAWREGYTFDTTRAAPACNTAAVRA